MVSVTLNNLSFKFQKFKPLGFKDLGIRKFEFVTMAQFLCFCFRNLVALALKQLHGCMLRVEERGRSKSSFFK